jgi:hypothetical protein
MKKLIALIIAVLTGLAAPAAAQSRVAAPIREIDAGVSLVEPFDAGVAPSVTVNAGSGSVVTVSPSATLPNPAEHPMQALDEAKLARKVGWPLAVFAVLVMLSKALAYGRDKLKATPLLGKAAVWLSTGKRAVLVAGFATVAAAGYDILAAGGSLVAALFAASMAVAGAIHSTTKGAAA